MYAFGRAYGLPYKMATFIATKGLFNTVYSEQMAKQFKPKRYTINNVRRIKNWMYINISSYYYFLFVIASSRCTKRLKTEESRQSAFASPTWRSTTSQCLTFWVRSQMPAKHCRWWPSVKMSLVSMSRDCRCILPRTKRRPSIFSLRYGGALKMDGSVKLAHLVL